MAQEAHVEAQTCDFICQDHAQRRCRLGTTGQQGRSADPQAPCRPQPQGVQHLSRSSRSRAPGVGLASPWGSVLPGDARPPSGCPPEERGHSVLMLPSQGPFPGGSGAPAFSVLPALPPHAARALPAAAPRTSQRGGFRRSPAGRWPPAHPPLGQKLVGRPSGQTMGGACSRSPWASQTCKARSGLLLLLPNPLVPSLMPTGHPGLKSRAPQPGTLPVQVLTTGPPDAW